MKRLVIAAALLALGACQSAGGMREGERLNWRCADEQDFSLRHVPSGIEVFAGGQTYRLEAVAGSDDQYSNGVVTYVEANSHATLTGANGGPYENCQQRLNDWWFDFW